MVGQMGPVGCSLPPPEVKHLEQCLAQGHLVAQSVKTVPGTQEALTTHEPHPKQQEAGRWPPVTPVLCPLGTVSHGSLTLTM